MSKEHPGGPFPASLQRVPVEWTRTSAGHDQPTPIAIADFDFDSLDTLEAQAAELLAAGQPIGPLLQSRAQRDLRKARLDGFIDCLALMLSARRPRMRAWAIAYGIGSPLALGKSGPEIARQFGRSKQAFFQEVERVFATLGIRILRLNQRDASARARMRARNYRPGIVVTAMKRSAGEKEKRRQGESLPRPLAPLPLCPSAPPPA